jgi:hypothetical protein
MRQIFLTGFKFNVQPTAAQFAGVLMHLGRQRFRNYNGKVVEFCSNITTIGIQSRWGNGPAARLGGEGGRPSE